MRSIFATFLRLPEKIRFIIAGGINTGVGFLIFWSLFFLQLPFLNYQAILVIAHFLTVSLAYFTLKYAVFQSKRSGFLAFCRCHASYLFVLGANMLVLSFFVEVLHVAVVQAQLLSVMVVTVISYYTHKYVSFPAEAKH